MDTAQGIKKEGIPFLPPTEKPKTPFFEVKRKHRKYNPTTSSKEEGKTIKY